LWSFTAQAVGTPEQVERENKRFVEGNYFFGGAVNPRDSDLKVTEAADGKHIVFNGRKAFSTGSKVSDLSALYIHKLPSPPLY
jgi:alkylation response protein AidB-like acyl-CoA dehydrogenase